MIVVFIFAGIPSTGFARMMAAQQQTKADVAETQPETSASASKGYIDIGRSGAPYDDDQAKAERMSDDELEKMKKKILELNHNIKASAGLQAVQQPNTIASTVNAIETLSAAKQAKQVQELPKAVKTPSQAPKF